MCDELEEWKADFQENASEIEKLCFKYLVDDIGYDEEDAIAKIDEVCIWEGTIVEYAEMLMDDCYEIPSYLESYIDYDKFARDLEIGGDVYRLDYGLWVTNHYEF